MSWTLDNCNGAAQVFLMSWILIVMEHGHSSRLEFGADAFDEGWQMTGVGQP